MPTYVEELFPAAPSIPTSSKTSDITEVEPVVASFDLLDPNFYNWRSCHDRLVILWAEQWSIKRNVVERRFGVILTQVCIHRCIWHSAPQLPHFRLPCFSRALWSLRRVAEKYPYIPLIRSLKRASALMRFAWRTVPIEIRSEWVLRK